MNYTHIVIIGNNCKILIGDNCSLGGVEMFLMGNGNSIQIGSGCTFSNEVRLWATGSHPIYNCGNNQVPINLSKPIIIKDCVWVSKRAMILKGVLIGSNSIVGMGAIVTKDVLNSTIVAGNPARIVKQGVSWSMDRINV